MSDEGNVKSIRDYMLSKLTPEQKKMREEGFEYLGVNFFEGDFWLKPKSDPLTMYNEMEEYTLQNDTNLSVLSQLKVPVTAYEVSEDRMELEFCDKAARLIIWVNEKGKLQSQIKYNI